MRDCDVVLRLGPEHLCPGADERAVRAAVRRVVSELPGINAVRVERSEAPVADPQWIVLSPPDGGEALSDEARSRLQAQVRGAALVAIAAAQFGAGQAGPATSPPHAARPVTGGFADAQGYRPDTPPVGERSSPASAAQPGADAMASPQDRALLARLLDLVNPNADPEPLARGAIRRFGSFAAVLSAPTRDLRAVPGFGTHSVAAIKLVHEAALRLARAGVMHRPVLDDWPRLIDYLAAQLGREKIEQFRVLFLDERDRLLADEAQARGTVNHTPVYPREVVRRALELQAASVILVHNHPSGDPTPSRDDLAMTVQVGEAAAVLSIVLQDHVIVGNGRWLSFRQEGLL